MKWDITVVFKSLESVEFPGLFYFKKVMSCKPRAHMLSEMTNVVGRKKVRILCFGIQLTQEVL